MTLPLLSSLLKLAIDHFFIGVLPGKYSLVWRMELDGVYLNGDHSSHNRISSEARKRLRKRELSLSNDDGDDNSKNNRFNDR